MRLVINKNKKSSKKGLVGIKWLLLFISVLIAVLLIYPPLSNFTYNEENNLFIDSAIIQNYILLEKNEILQKIYNANALTQKELIETNSPTIESYNSVLDTKLKRALVNREVTYNTQTIEVNISASINNVEITQEVEFSKYKFKDLFFSQYQTLKSLEEDILTNQAATNSCYQDGFNKVSCHTQIIESLNLGSDIKCMTNNEGTNSIDCMFTLAPYTIFTSQLPQLAYEDDRRQLELEDSFIRINRDGDFEINVDELEINPSDIDRGYFLFIIPNEDSENIETLINTFENTLIQEGIVQGLNEARITEDSLFGRDEGNLNEYQTNVDEDNSLYELQINDKEIYLKVIIASGVANIIPNRVQSEELYNFFEFDSTHSIFITENRYFEDSSMYERGQLFEVPAIEEKTQGNNE